MKCANLNCQNEIDDSGSYCPICRLMLQIKYYDLYVCMKCGRTWCEIKEGLTAKTYHFDGCEHCITNKGKTKEWLLVKISIIKEKILILWSELRSLLTGKHRQ